MSGADATVVERVELAPWFHPDATRASAGECHKWTMITILFHLFNNTFL
jgi:hypothetical protein